MSHKNTSTLLATEKALQPVVLCVTFTSCCLVALLLAWSFLRVPVLLWLACAVPALALEASNLRYRRTHPFTTMGMIPIACFSLITPCIACLCSEDMTGMVRSIVWVALILLISLLSVFVVWFYRLRTTYSAHPQVAPDAALIVLGGTIRKDGPCETLALRLDVAERLWHQENGLTLVLTGGPTPDSRTTEARAMATYLQQRGVSPKAMLLETKARNTRENIALSMKLLDEHGHGGQRCVVSSNYHLWRALRDARATGCTLTPIAAPTPRASTPQQWCREVLTILAGR